MGIVEQFGCEVIPEGGDKRSLSFCRGHQVMERSWPGIGIREGRV